jgi:hypothetical protein
MIISLSAGVMTVRDIGHHLQRTLGTELSHDTISKITPQRLAEQHSIALGVRWFPIPADLPEFDVRMLWHARLDADPGTALAAQHHSRRARERCGLIYPLTDVGMGYCVNGLSSSPSPSGCWRQRRVGAYDPRCHRWLV